MGFGDTSVLCKVVFILLILCFIIDLIAFAIPFWYSLEYNVLGASVKSYGGLWDACAESGSLKSCASIKDSGLTDWFRAVRAFSILSWLFFLGALVVAIVFMFFMSGNKLLYLVAVCLSFAGAFCAMIAFAVYAGKLGITDYSASFALTIISFILGLIIGVLGILDYLGIIGGK
ncbi:hypothetical protein ACJMK2_022945 [Sinanodonta woodiana]|uniref:Uncharacterized protein n=1 Tax=Sinanodonta woodiana TaxID=1069815 RepID=A0ABD3TMR1_SINWO